MESFIIVTLRDILCGTLSLDDGLSAIQNMSIARQQYSDIMFEIARAIEEIILRRPKVASAKLTELSVRLAFNEERTLPELLLLLDTRYTSNYRRSECEILPDIEAIPNLLDILGELTQAIDSARLLNLRPLLPFLADEVLMTLDAICARHHKQSSHLAMRETHYLASILNDFEFYEGAELLLNRLMELTLENDLKEFWFEVSLDEAFVLTELQMYEDARRILKVLEKVAKKNKDLVQLAAVKLTLCINETRDDSVDYTEARKIGDEAASLFQQVLDLGESTQDGLGLAHLVIGSSILVNGWREAIPQAIERLERSLEIFQNIDNRSTTQSLLLYRTLVDLAFAHGLLADHENMTKCVEYFDGAKKVLEELESRSIETKQQLASCENALGWVCLCSECDEFWSLGLKAFEVAESIRSELLQNEKITELEFLGTRVGHALSHMRIHDEVTPEHAELLREALASYFPLFPVDERAYVELAIATYDVVWLALRHNLRLPDKILRLLEDIDKMLTETTVPLDSACINSVSLVVPFFMDDWPTLYFRAISMANLSNEVSGVARLMAALASAKMNLEEMSIEARVRMISSVDELIRDIDPLLMQYWVGQNILAKTMKAFYDNKDYSELATGFHKAAASLKNLEDMEIMQGESAEFIRATGLSLSYILLKFADVLERQYGAEIERTANISISGDLEQFEILLADNWIGLLRITENYLLMVEQLELSRAQPYLNAVFSNMTRALRMMDTIALVDRRVLSYLGDMMGRRYYLR